MSNAFVRQVSLQYFHTVMHRLVAQASIVYTCAKHIYVEKILEV